VTAEILSCPVPGRRAKRTLRVSDTINAVMSSSSSSVIGMMPMDVIIIIMDYATNEQIAQRTYDVLRLLPTLITLPSGAGLSEKWKERPLETPDNNDIISDGCTAYATGKRYHLFLCSNAALIRYNTGSKVYKLTYRATRIRSKLGGQWRAGLGRFTWTPLPIAMDDAMAYGHYSRIGSAAVIVKKQLFVMSGSSKRTTVIAAGCSVLDLKTNVRTSIPDIPFPVEHAGIFAKDDKIYLFGNVLCHVLPLFSNS
jgi:hypothetical protein